MIFLFPPLLNRFKFSRRNKIFYYHLHTPWRQEVLILSGCWFAWVYEEHIPLKLTYSLFHFFFYKIKPMLNKNLLVTRHGYLSQPWMLILILFIPFTSFGSHENHGVEELRGLLSCLSIRSISQKWVSRILEYGAFSPTMASKTLLRTKSLLSQISFQISAYLIGKNTTKSERHSVTFLYHWLKCVY